VCITTFLTLYEMTIVHVGILVENEHKYMIPFFVKLCSDRAAYEVKLQRRIYLRMDRLKQLFEATEEYELVVYTPYITIIKCCKGAEVTFSKDGRVLIKKVLNKSEAETIAEDVLQIALRASTK